MKLTYDLAESDFVAFQLFNASNSESIKKKQRNSWIIMTAISAGFAIVFYFNGNGAISLYFAALAIITAVFYPKYFKRRYKRHYERYIRENYKNRTDIEQTFIINEDHVFLQDKTGEGRVNLSEIKSVTETADHFFFTISTDVSLIIPKRKVAADELRQTIQSRGLNIIESLDWKW